MPPKKRQYVPASTEYVKISKGLPRPDNISLVESTSGFLEIVENDSKIKLVVAMFFLEDSIPCRQMRELFVEEARKYPCVSFVEVEMDTGADTADIFSSQAAETLPNFTFYKESKAVHKIEGAFPDEFKKSLRLLAVGEEADIDKNAGLSDSHSCVDLFYYINMKQSECLNGSDSTPFQGFLERTNKLVSDCDEQLILTLGFNQEIKVKHFKMKAPSDKGPKFMKIFVNQVKSLGFDDVVDMAATYELSLKAEELDGHSVVLLPTRWFDKVRNMCIFISNNQCNGEETVLEGLNFFGVPINKHLGAAGRTTTVVS